MALQEQCPCGRYVRMVNTKERSSYTPGKRKYGKTPPSMHVFVTHPAYDGLCTRCRDHGIPDYKFISPSGEQEKNAYKRRTHNQKAYDRLEAL